jgi:hypothetical protein
MVDGFLRAGAGKNRSPETIRADRTDLNRFLSWLRDENALIVSPADVPTEDVLELLGKPAHRSLAGISRWRKLAAVRECVRYAKQIKAIAENPTDGIDTPKLVSCEITRWSPAARAPKISVISNPLSRLPRPSATWIIPIVMVVRPCSIRPRPVRWSRLRWPRAGAAPQEHDTRNRHHVDARCLLASVHKALKALLEEPLFE